MPTEFQYIFTDTRRKIEKQQSNWKTKRPSNYHLESRKKIMFKNTTETKQNVNQNSIHTHRENRETKKDGNEQQQ